jgi:hypothetical protein
LRFFFSWQQCADRLLDAMTEQVDINFDKFELYVANNIFSFPADLDTGASNNNTTSAQTEHEDTLKQITELKKQMFNVRQLNILSIISSLYLALSPLLFCLHHFATNKQTNKQTKNSFPTDPIVRSIFIFWCLFFVPLGNT